MLAIGFDAAPMRAQDAVLRGVVYAAGDRTPLVLSWVTIEELGRETVTDQNGRFRFDSLPVGRPVSLRVRRIGFRPFMAQVVARSLSGSELEVGLVRLAQELPAAQVTAPPSCWKPADTSLDSITPLGRAVLSVVRQGSVSLASTKTFPFSYRMARLYSYSTWGGLEIPIGEDTVHYRGEATAWPYSPGNHILDGLRDDHYREPLFRVLRTNQLGRPTYFDAARLPLLPQFAQQAFLQSHCFNLAGVEPESDSTVTLRVDFRVSRIAGSDFSGSFFLDPSDLTLHRAVLRFVPVPRAASGVREIVTDIAFRRTGTGVWLPETIATWQTLERRGDDASPQIVLDRQRLLGVEPPRPPRGRP